MIFHKKETEKNLVSDQTCAVRKALVTHVKVTKVSEVDAPEVQKVGCLLLFVVGPCVNAAIAVHGTQVVAEAVSSQPSGTG